VNWKDVHENLVAASRVTLDTLFCRRSLRSNSLLSMFGKVKKSTDMELQSLAPGDSAAGSVDGREDVKEETTGGWMGSGDTLAGKNSENGKGRVQMHRTHNHGEHHRTWRRKSKPRAEKPEDEESVRLNSGQPAFDETDGSEDGLDKIAAEEGVHESSKQATSQEVDDKVGTDPNLGSLSEERQAKSQPIVNNVLAIFLFCSVIALIVVFR